MAAATAVKGDTIRRGMVGCPGSQAGAAGTQETSRGGMAGAQWEARLWHIRPLNDMMTG